MFTTGSKLFLGLSAAATAGLVLYGVTQGWEELGVVGLGFAAVAFAFLGGISLFIRDGNVSAMDAAAVATAPAGNRAPRGALWPLVGAIGAGLLVIGLVTDRRWFVAGLVVLSIAVVEWMVTAWAERASADREYNDEVRDRIIHPLEFPILAAVGLGIIIWAFSRIMLYSEAEVGLVVFSSAAAILTVFGFIFAAKRRPSRGVMTGICCVGALALLVPGIFAGSEGEREELAKEAEHFEEERHQCGEEANEADEKASGSVAAKSALTAEIELSGDRLTITEFGEPAEYLYAQRNNPTNIMFKNNNGGDELHRLVATYLVGSESGLTEEKVCTNAIEDGKVQFLTLTFPKPSSIAPEGREFMLTVPGIEGAELEIVVP